MADILSLCTLLTCFSTIVILLRFFGKSGLFAYSAVAIIISNIQVLRLTKYSFFSHEVALGTVVFATTFAVDNILIEYFGVKQAKRSVYLGFIIFLFFSVAMKIATWHPEVSNTGCSNYSKEIAVLFSQEFTLLTASIAAYLTGQFCDIFVFTLLHKISKLSLKSFISMAVSTFVDNVTFSVLAWIVFAKNPISWNELWNTYIINLYILRLAVVFACVPLVKMVKFIGVDRVREF